MQAPLFDMMVLQGGVFMALLSCPECGNEVSSNADFCPQCGYSFKTQNQRKVMYNVLPFVFFRNRRVVRIIATRNDRDDFGVDTI